ncbi:Tissue factor pathway inhibitor [Camelus dromedarius]|uniref:Tissue factor pathway inhibitor n=1 Tax=Camelus dromedarius TaxID=9838 RepID=A0A5N4E7A3_CAMDR|nr:Tissue factor pathway inhibitor [Camelus dromedarius]
MNYTMKKEQIFLAFVCLLLSCASAPLTAVPEEDEEHTNSTDAELPPLKLVHSFCALKADDGPCKAMMKRFFFNIHTQQCEEFVYGGCEGNQNRFESLEECKEKCTRDYPKKIRTKTILQKGKPDFCFLEEDAGICRGYITSVLYFNWLYFVPVNDFQVNDYRTPLDAVNNDSLTPQPTKASSFFDLHDPMSDPSKMQKMGMQLSQSII